MGDTAWSVRCWYGYRGFGRNAHCSGKFWKPSSIRSWTQASWQRSGSFSHFRDKDMVEVILYWSPGEVAGIEQRFSTVTPEDFRGLLKLSKPCSSVLPRGGAVDGEAAVPSEKFYAVPISALWGRFDAVEPAQRGDVRKRQRDCAITEKGCTGHQKTDWEAVMRVTVLKAVPRATSGHMQYVHFIAGKFPGP